MMKVVPMMKCRLLQLMVAYVFATTSGIAAGFTSCARPSSRSRITLASKTLGEAVCAPSRLTPSRRRRADLCMSTPINDEEDGGDENEREIREAATNALYVPLTLREMVKQVADAMDDAFEKRGMTRQILRVLLPRDPSSALLGRMYEVEARQLNPNNLILYPVDESWQGGIMQLYRAAAPTCQAILRKFSKNDGGLPPRMVEDRSVDASGVDGIGLWMANSANPENDVSCFVQPSQETIDAIETISSQAGRRRVVALLNPQWRTVDDAFDRASRGPPNGLAAGLASFLGGKGRTLRRLDDLGFRPVYTLEGYVCKGGNIRLLKRFDSDWVAFAENDEMSGFIKIGTSSARPTYQDVDRMLDDMGVQLKYARDMGIAPKI